MARNKTKNIKDKEKYKQLRKACKKRRRERIKFSKSVKGAFINEANADPQLETHAKAVIEDQEPRTNGVASLSSSDNIILHRGGIKEISTSEILDPRIV